ncbi:MAG TPA: 23S rRNA (guanosine(2251)-2'-O)-methyltransferase RlmB [Pyrinomonadaceae bacterium]|nr:23S rRNA (guanosine(2251)-2'-O)-methyltransferase RlmB [Pyrinomonadaceae bacterium]
MKRDKQNKRGRRGGEGAPWREDVPRPRPPRRPEGQESRPEGGARREERGGRREDEGAGRFHKADERGRERFTRPRESPGERVARAFSDGRERERRPREFGSTSRDSAAASRDAATAKYEPARVRPDESPRMRSDEPTRARQPDDGAHVFGVQPVLEALRAGARPVERITLAEGAHESRLREILEIARYADIPVRRVPRAELQRIAAGANHQGVVATIAAAHYTHADELLDALAARVGTQEQPLAVVLDGVEDPRNLGAIIRTVECAGAHGVFVPERRAAGLTETVAKAAAGALEYVPVARVQNVVRLLEELKERGVWTVGTTADAETSYTDWDWTQPCALLLGGEGEGLRRLVRERCDVLVGVPLRGRIESLNVSVAAGVVLYEALRQRTAQRAGAYSEEQVISDE